MYPTTLTTLPDTSPTLPSTPPSLPSGPPPLQWREGRCGRWFLPTSQVEVLLLHPPSLAQLATTTNMVEEVEWEGWAITALSSTATLALLASAGDRWGVAAALRRQVEGWEEERRAQAAFMASLGLCRAEEVAVRLAAMEEAREAGRSRRLRSGV